MNNCQSTFSAIFKVPRDGEIFISSVYERCENFITNGIWTGIDILDLERWWSNFSLPEEMYFAACILDSLIYRSKKQTLSLIKHLFQRTLPDLVRVNPMPIRAPTDWISFLGSSHEIGVRLVAAVKKEDPPTKSAYLVLRMMKQEFSINEKFIVKPEMIEDSVQLGINVFIFIDDFLGTGEQFSETIINEGIEPYLSTHYVAYVPLVAHEVGIKKLNFLYPNLKLASVELLEEANGLFHTNSCCFNDELNNTKAAKEFYYALLKQKDIQVRDQSRRGFGKLELAYSFEHATPDNSLPILWWKNSKKFKPLFKR